MRTFGKGSRVVVTRGEDIFAGTIIRRSKSRKWMIRRDGQKGGPPYAVATEDVRPLEAEKVTMIRGEVVGSDGLADSAHYGGAENPYEAIKVIEAWDLGFCLGNTVKYISRAGKKKDQPTLKDLRKARWYLDREIQNLERNGEG